MNAARDLAATGTPGPWRFTDSETVNDVYEDGLTIVWYDGDPIANVRDEWYEPDDDPTATPFHDANKIVRAVNALPAIADHGDAVKAYREHRRGYGTQHTCDRCTSLLRAVFTTWGAVAAALTGETP